MRGLITICLTAVLLTTGSAWAYSGGSGTPDDPYKIADSNDWQQLMNTSNDWNKNFLLTADIDMTGVSSTPVGNDTTQFIGVFDGNNHVIHNVTINLPESDYVGIFGWVGSGGQIKNLGVEDANITGNALVGGLCGFNGDWEKLTGSVISNCYVTGAVNGPDYVGGLVGENYGSVTSCHVTGSVTGDEAVGGLIGENSGGNVTNCYATGNVSGTSSFVGGLVGRNIGGNVTSCYTTGSVSGNDDTGGLVGNNSRGSITSCHATGPVNGQHGSDVGGLVGRNEDSNITITSCYATGSVNGGWAIGGLVGLNGGSVTNCYATGSVTGIEGYIGGLVGSNGGSLISCYATGSVSGQWSVGGLVGTNVHDGSVTSCYATGSVTGIESSIGGLVGSNYGSITVCYAVGSVSGQDYVGGLVGFNFRSITSSYATGLVSGISYVGGVVGRNSGNAASSFWDINTSGQSTSAGGTGKTTAEMKTLSTFTSAGWDFVETWGIAENQTYPFLKTESAGDLNYDKKVDFTDFAIFAQHWLEGVNP